jgi:hypothetical protein
MSDNRNPICDLLDSYGLKLLAEEGEHLPDPTAQIVELAASSEHSDYHFVYRVALVLINIARQDRRHRRLARKYLEQLLEPEYDPYMVGYRDIVLAHILISLAELSVFDGDCEAGHAYMQVAIAEGTHYIRGELEMVRRLVALRCAKGNQFVRWMTGIPFAMVSTGAVADGG